MQAHWFAAIDRAPSGDLDASKHFFKEVSQLDHYFLGTFLPSSTWSRDTVNMQRICLASLFEATSAFQILGKSALEYFSALFDVVTGHRKYGVILRGWTFLIFRTFSTWPRDTVNMQRIELSAFCSLPSSLCSLLAAFGHAVCGRGEGKAISTPYLRGILSTHSRSPLKMRRFEPSIRVPFSL